MASTPGPGNDAMGAMVREMGRTRMKRSTPKPRAVAIAVPRAWEPASWWLLLAAAALAALSFAALTAPR
jgi:hypothetical protein